MKLRFIDSYKFLNISLDKLSSFLGKDKLRILQREFCNLSAENFNLLTRKGIFPTSTLIALKNWRRSVYHRANLFTVHWRVTSYPKTITLSTCGSGSLSKRSSTAICTSKSMSCWLIFLKTFATIASLVTDSITHIHFTGFYMERDVKIYTRQF